MCLQDCVQTEVSYAASVVLTPFAEWAAKEQQEEEVVDELVAEEVVDEAKPASPPPPTAPTPTAPICRFNRRRGSAPTAFPTTLAHSKHLR